MVRRASMANGAIAESTGYKPAPASRLPAAIRLPLFVLLSAATNAGLNYVVGEATESEAALVSRTPSDEISLIVVAWKVVLLGVGWFGGFDPYDFTYLTALINFPFHYFRYAFYSVSAYTSIVSFVADSLAVFIPLILLRRKDPIHNPNAPKGSVPNREIVKDPVGWLGTSLFATAIYGSALLLSYRTFLPEFLVVHFDGLPTVEEAHVAEVPQIWPICLVLGFAVSDFLLHHYLAAQTNLRDIRQETFNPATASLLDTVIYNIWGYSKKTRVLVSRTLILALLTGLNTWIRTWTNLVGAESEGAMGWASIWMAATLVVGLAFSWVGGGV